MHFRRFCNLDLYIKRFVYKQTNFITETKRLVIIEKKDEQGIIQMNNPKPISNFLLY